VRPAAASNPPDAKTPAWAAKLITIRFGGGTVREYMEQIQTAVAPATINVTFEGNAAKAKLPPVDLVNVSVQSAMDVLSRMGGGGGPGMGRAYRATLISGSAVPDETPVYAVGEINPNPGMMRQLSPMNGVANQVLSIADAIGDPNAGGVDARSILQAIESAVEAATRDGDGAAIIKFHEPTATLVVSGTQWQCSVAAEVVQNLSKTGKQKATQRLAFDLPSTKIVPLSHANAAEVVEAINSVFRGRPGELTEVVAATGEGNSLTITSPPRLLVGAQAIISLLDRPEPPAAVRNAKEVLHTASLELHAVREQMARAKDESAVQSAELRKRIADAEVQATEAKQANAIAEVRMPEMKKQFEELRERFNNVSSSYKSIVGAIGDKDTKISELQKRNQELQADLTTLRAELAKLKK